MKMKATILKPLASIIMILAGGTLGGCAGYTTASQYPDDVETVAVDIFARGKDVYRRGIEMRITEAIVKQIELDTPYKVTKKSRADTQLSGTLEVVNQRVLSTNTLTGQPHEIEITLEVSFTWKDLRSGKILAEQSSMPMAATYIPQDPFSEDFFQGSEDDVNRLAARIVEQMEKW